MAVLTADDLLIGPRGRGVCMAVAHRLNVELWSAWQARDTADRDVLIRALEAVDPTPVYAWRDPLAFLEPMDWSVSNAVYWQPPHEDDVVAADPGVVAALRPVADAAAPASALAWWSTPVDLAALRYTSRFRPRPPSVAARADRSAGTPHTGRRSGESACGYQPSQVAIDLPAHRRVDVERVEVAECHPAHVGSLDVDRGLPTDRSTQQPATRALEVY